MKTQLFQTADDIADNWQLYAANEAPGYASVTV